MQPAWKLTCWREDGGLAYKANTAFLDEEEKNILLLRCHDSEPYFHQELGPASGLLRLSFEEKVTINVSHFFLFEHISLFED